jgi:hypothetical protein
VYPAFIPTPNVTKRMNIHMSNTLHVKISFRSQDNENINKILMNNVKTLDGMEIISSYSIGPVNRFVCISFRTDYLY